MPAALEDKLAVGVYEGCSVVNATRLWVFSQRKALLVLLNM